MIKDMQRADHPTGLLRDGNPEQPALDMELTGAILQAVAARSAAATIRIFRPGATVALGRQDRLRPGFGLACRLALARGYAPLIRHAGGHAVVYDTNAIIIEVLRPEDGLIGLETRLTELASLIRAAVRELGIELELGELPNEYCPGRFSLHLSDGPKVAGIAQRIIRGASLTTAVLSVGSNGALREVVSDIYAALELPLDPATVGAIADRFAEVKTHVVATTLADLALEHYAATPQRGPGARLHLTGDAASPSQPSVGCSCSAVGQR
jgi:octanoyl-[GcvH]:protein N-octanoyltransferase